MSLLKSKYSWLFKLQVIAIPTISLIAIIYCFYNSIDSDGVIFYGNIFYAGVTITVISLFEFLGLFELYRIVMTEEEMIKIKLIGKKTIIRFDEIEDIKKIYNRVPKRRTNEIQ